LTLNVNSVNSELTISGTLNGKNTYSDGTYTVSWNGSRWEVYEEVSGCDVISVTYALVGGEPVTVEVEKEEDGRYRFEIDGNSESPFMLFDNGDVGEESEFLLLKYKLFSPSFKSSVV
jgi:hypothetical protein